MTVIRTSVDGGANKGEGFVAAGYNTMIEQCVVDYHSHGGINHGCQPPCKDDMPPSETETEPRFETIAEFFDNKDDSF